MSERPAPLEPTHWCQVALSSIGDAVVVTDAQGCVLFMNPVAEMLTGWPAAEAVGQQLGRVFRIVNEQTGQPVVDPVTEVFARGVVVGLANHTLLIARDGVARPIDDSAAPTRDVAGRLTGAVLVFRDVSERRRAELAAQDALTYTESIVDTVREPLVVLDAGLRVRTANRSFYHIFAGSPAATEGRLVYELGNRQWDIPRLREMLEAVLVQDSHFNDFEVNHEFEGLGRRTMLLNARRLDRLGDGVGLILLAIEDVTRQREAISALAVSETRYRRLFETAQDGILILEGDTGRIFDANPYLMDLLGFGREELVGKELWELGLFHDAVASRDAFSTLQQQGYIRYDDLPLQTRDGRGIAVEFISNVYLVDHRRVIQCNIRDVTARKQAEEALREAHDELERRVQFRTGELARLNEALTAEVVGHRWAEAGRLEVLQRLATAQEAERHRLARELHDQMGQHLTALSLGLKSLWHAVPERSSARATLRQMQELSDRMGREVHQLALELRPTALDDLGLHTALAHYIDSWSEQAGVEADFQSTGLDGGRLPPLLETALYRVVQEALTNVRKHAASRRVSVILRRTAQEALAVVEDDGRGFEAEAPAIAGRLGLLGMRERLALVGGKLVVESAPGKGTTVFARIPLATVQGERE